MRACYVVADLRVLAGSDQVIERLVEPGPQLFLIFGEHHTWSAIGAFVFSRCIGLGHSRVSRPLGHDWHESDLDLIVDHCLDDGFFGREMHDLARIAFVEPGNFIAFYAVFINPPPIQDSDLQPTKFGQVKRLEPALVKKAIS